MAFRPPEHWIINHRVGSTLPGYLMIGSRVETTNLFELPTAALTELGCLMSSVQKALMEALRPDQIYFGRYGHQQGYSIHFHVIPIYPWVKDAISADPRYGILKSLYTPGVANSDFDGAEMTLYTWREFL